MGKGIHLFVLFSVLVVQTKSYSPGFGHQSFLPVSKLLKSVSRVARQESSAQCEDVTQKVINQQICFPSFGQNYVNRISQCGTNISMDAINAVEMFCKNNSAVEFCPQIFHLENALSNCNLSRSRNYCATECEETLTDAGCCFSNFTFLEGLYTLCAVDFPAPCPGSSINIPPITSDDPTCQTEEDFFRLLTEFSCSVDSPILDFQNFDNCPNPARSYEIQCSRHDGELCIYSAAGNSTITELASAAMECPSLSSLSNCSTSCNVSLTNFKKNFGCCLHLYNSSYTIGTEYFSPDSPFATIFDNGLWQECGITPPGSCFVSASSSTLVGNMAFVILSVTFYFIYTM